MDDLTTQNQDQTADAHKAPGEPAPFKTKDPTAHVRKAIRTYYSDIAETVKGKDVSMADIALAEQKRQEEHPEKIPPHVQEREDEKEKRGWGTFAIILAVVLVLGGGGILGFLYFYAPKQETVLPEPHYTTLIPADGEKVLDVTGLPTEDIITLIQDERLKLDGTLNTVITFVPVDAVGEGENILPARALLTRLDTHADTALLRSVLDEYSLGVHLFDKNHGFLIVKTDFFENAFAGMLRWEKYLAEDLPFLTQDPSPTLKPEAPASTTEPVGSVVLEPIERYAFEDVVIANRDVRALVNSVTGDIKMLYSFPDKNTLIITTNPNTLKELFTRLTVVRRQ